LLGDLVAELRRAVERFAVERVVVRLRVVLRRAAGLRVEPVVVFVVVLVFSAIAGISPFGLARSRISSQVCSPLTIPANICL
jgi:hypothetical protein